MTRALPVEWPADELERVETCPICGATERVLVYEDLQDRIFGAAGRWQLYRCGSCSGGYLDPRPTRKSIGGAYHRYFSREPEDEPPPPRLASIRKALWNGYLNTRYAYSFQPATPIGAIVLPLFRKRRWSAALTVRGLTKPPGRPRLLDVGFGDGSFLRFMRSAGWEVAGLEPDEEAVRVGEALGLDVTRGVLEDAPFPENSFDAITLSHVIEHLHDPGASLEACRRLLLPNGILWLTTPNLDSLGHRRFGRDWFGLDPPRHLVLFGGRSLDRALTRAGFVDVRYERTYRAELVLAGSDALATGRDASKERTPASRKLRGLARVLDLAATVRPRWGEELMALARRPPG